MLISKDRTGEAINLSYLDKRFSTEDCEIFPEKSNWLLKKRLEVFEKETSRFAWALTYLDFNPIYRDKNVHAQIALALDRSEKVLLATEVAYLGLVIESLNRLHVSIIEPRRTATKYDDIPLTIENQDDTPLTSFAIQRRDPYLEDHDLGLATALISEIKC